MPGDRHVVKQIRSHGAPAWWRDAKLGIFVHWTPASVPAFAPVEGSVAGLLASGDREAMSHSPYSEWYENSLRFPSSPAARHHAEHHPGRDYHEFGAEWEAALDRWDPGAWAERFAESGARYVVLVAKHHDGYCLWPTSVANPNRPGWNCRRDVVGELAEAVRAEGLRFGVYYSGGLDWTFNDHPIGTFSDLLTAQPRGDYVAYAEAQVRELIRLYRPSVLWNDISWPAGAGALAGLFADYYRAVPEGVVNDRFMPWSALWRFGSTALARRVIDGAVARAARTDRGVIPPRPPMYDVRTPEYTVFGSIQREPWECVRGIDSSFGHNRASDESRFLARDELLWSLVDIASKGGNLLLNVGPRGEDAAIPERQLLRLEWLGEFTAANGEALFGSRPWVAPSGDAGGCDVRYTARDQRLFAFLRPAGSGGVALEAVKLEGVELGPASRVTDLAGEDLRAEMTAGGLSVRLRRPATRDELQVIVITGGVARSRG